MSDIDPKLSAFFSKFQELLKEERNTDIELTSLLLTKCSPKLLEKKGLALLNLSVCSISIGLGGKSLIELERPLAHHVSQVFPPHSIRTGDLARIEANIQVNPKKQSQKDTEKLEAQGLEGVVFKVSDTRIILALDSDKNEDVNLPDNCRLLKLVNTVTYDRMEKAIDTLRASFGDKSATARELKVNDMHRVLLALRPLHTPDDIGTDDLVWYSESLNESQRNAVKFALGMPEVACIWGPPGTGKTHTLIELILQLLSRDLRVLVCGASNLSVDNILERLVKVRDTYSNSRPLPKLDMLRISHPARTLSYLTDNTLDFRAKHSDGAELARDCKMEMESKIAFLTGKGGTKGKGGKARLTKEERRKGWEEVRELRKEYRKREANVVKHLVKNSNVVLATCHSAGTSQLNNELFDVLVIDEATQAMEPVCWIPIFKARKLVLAGDPMQLPPTVLSTEKHQKKSTAKQRPKKTKQEKHESEATGSGSETDPEPSATQETNAGELLPPYSLSQTLFRRLDKAHGAKVKVMLNTQYRMNQKIAAFPSKELYEGKLESHSTVKDHLLSDIVETSPDNDWLSQPVVFFDTSGLDYFERTETEGGADDSSKCNENEAALVVRYIQKLIEAGVTPEQTAIITPYQAQVQLISSLIRPQFPNLEIGSVDGMQGREQEVIILSLVRSNEQREVGFLKDKRRLNVAMTRAKRQLCIVGDSGTIKAGGRYLRQWVQWLEDEADVQYGGLDS